LDELEQIARSDHPGYKVSGVLEPRERNQPVTVVLERKKKRRPIFFDPYTGADLGNPESRMEAAIQWVVDLHGDLLLGKTGRFANGIGSALACGQILRVMGKDVEVVMHDGVPRIYQNLPFADRAIQADAVPPNDAVILLECDSTQRALLEGLKECFLINIDHHVSGRNFAHINWIDSSVMATAELVYRLAGWPASRSIAISPPVSTLRS
jgi:hypothetical protein